MYKSLYMVGGNFLLPFPYLTVQHGPCLVVLRQNLVRFLSSVLYEEVLFLLIPTYSKYIGLIFGAVERVLSRRHVLGVRYDPCLRKDPRNGVNEGCESESTNLNKENKVRSHAPCACKLLHCQGV